MPNLRLAFMGTPDFAVPTLLELIGAGYEIVAVYTQPPRPAGRGQALQKSAVHEIAEAHGIPVHTPKSLKGAEEQKVFADLDLDAAVVAAYGLILPPPILEAPKLGCLNVHASLLPRWRGAAPIQRAIMAGDQETGVAVMKMAEGLDTGPILLMERIAITPDTTGGTLHDEIARLGASLMVRALNALKRGTLTQTPQADVGDTYASKIKKDETPIDWSRPAREIDWHIRGLAPVPGAWFDVAKPGASASKPIRIKVLRAKVKPSESLANDSKNLTPGTVIDDALTIACGEGALQILALQRQGRGAMSAADFLRGFPIPVGTKLT